ncbi:DUF317 domain-containing protein [Streptomyces europaeiscabiei]|uniref:DUF317 domain-containing protein n=1 Tax=Streptomyces europaeiscabiei TaxID=146819 RepID=UPI0029BE9E0E|nr:DUF317 domain-containing protein [Streptomyces europaeiscabiei]MDX3616493.1 DUF317 domain-containing protein [Streptomyces europaeiscabiei]
MTPTIDAHVRLDSHPTHPSAVTAVLTGTQAHVAHLGLEAADWIVVTDNVLVLVRIDHEEPYWAQDAAKHLSAEGIAVEITPRLREAMDEEWTWANYPMPWCTRSEIREVSNEAQKIHDDIRHGQLLIHAHAHDGHTTVAVGTYLGPNAKSVYLHGEDHLRQIADTFDSPAGALLAFEKVHGAEMRPGPAPLTDSERAAAEARTPLALTAATTEPARPEPETVPAYLADTGDHDALLDTFLDGHGGWEKWRTWSDETTHAIHESQTLRIERVHETPAHETAWTMAAYETPVSDRMWVLTATGATPAPVLQELLDHLADGDGWDTAIGAPVDEKMVTAATQPLSDAGWKHTVDGRWIRWTSPTGDAGVQFDAFTAQHPNQNLVTWTVWAGPDPDRPTWTITASPHTPSSLLADLSETLAHETGTRRAPTAGPERRMSLLPSSPTAPAVAAGPAASRSR